MPALEARDWLTEIDGIGKKTASIVLLFCFGMPLMPIDRHVERVVAADRAAAARRRPIDQAHDLFLGLLEPDQMYEAHVILIHHGREICHAQRPEHERCPVRDRCRFVDPKAPVASGAMPILGAMLSGAPTGYAARRRRASCSSTTTRTCSSCSPTSSAPTATRSRPRATATRRSAGCGPPGRTS